MGPGTFKMAKDLKLAILKITALDKCLIEYDVSVYYYAMQIFVT